MEIINPSYSMLEDYKFIAANNSQTDAIQALVFLVLGEYGLKRAAIDNCLDDVEGYYFKNNGFFGVLLNKENKIVATAGLARIDDESAEIRKMYMLPECRGKGLGKFMLTTLIEKARALQFKRIELETASVLKEAIGLYQKFGFVPYQPEHITPRCDQAYELML